MSPLFGIRPCAKLDMLCLSEPAMDDSMLGDGLEHAASSAGSSDGSDRAWEGTPSAEADEADVAAEAATDDAEDDGRADEPDAQMVGVEMRGPDGVRRLMRLPLEVVARLMASLEAGAEGTDDDQ